MGPYIRVAGYFIPVLIARLFARPSVFTKLACLSLSFVPIAWLHPIWEKLIEAVLKPHIRIDSPLSDFEIGGVFLSMCLFFALLAHLASKEVPPEEALRDAKVVSPAIPCGKSRIYLYLGNIRNLQGEVEAIVTSEDASLDLGNISGTSVSGRVRRMAADLATTGEVVKDNLREGLDRWKAAYGRQSPFALGTVVSQEPFRADLYGIKRIFHAVVLQRNSDGSVYLDESAVRECMSKVLDECGTRKIQTVFVPLFGTGGGYLTPQSAAQRTIAPLFQLLEQRPGFELYIGTYRLSAMAATWAALGAMS